MNGSQSSSFFITIRKLKPSFQPNTKGLKTTSFVLGKKCQSVSWKRIKERAYAPNMPHANNHRRLAPNSTLWKSNENAFSDDPVPQNCQIRTPFCFVLFCFSPSSFPKRTQATICLSHHFVAVLVCSALNLEEYGKDPDKIAYTVVKVIQNVPMTSKVTYSVK